MALNSRLEVLKKEDFARVHEASLKILRETGARFLCDEALEVFKKHGARVVGKTVFFTEKMIEQALATAPKTFRMRARNEDNSITVGEGFLIQPNVGPVYIQNLDQGRRKATLADYANIQKLCQASDVVHLVGTIPVDPSDVPRGDKYLTMMYETLKYTDKPVIGFTTNAKQAREQLDMVELSMGQSEFLRDNHCVAVLVNSLSPLGYAPETLETMIEYAKRNQVILLAPCIMAGVSGPVTPLGTAVLQNAEILAGLVLMQMVNPGTPVVYATASTSAYMKTASYAAGAPEAMLINTANLQMGLDFYHLPTRTMTGITHSKVVDAQAGYETMQSLLLGMLSGAHMAVQCLGVLDAIMTTSYEKFIIDEELIRRVLRIQQGIDTSDEALAVDVIQEVGHDGSYLMHMSTFEQFRTIWTPTISDWESFDDWKEAGAEDVVSKANRRYKKILQEASDSLLDPATDQELQAYIEKAKS
ncbi:trimethylamine-corrinoid protein Co-methyltransferase [Acididesulfobacillus acetoxydans]|uniref:Methyltransferase n=1 Tax=Acididesulfobacillus acetoxydans TaxID=1561005 RepID=A0A8S0Y4Y1_9FIRM|nr:trimethylamine methyltransferase family protein [Acididesulfobacillus acetoxydans]CAA7603425.1 trimethylamine-corrinoid protein Co-methyltransferase [Acididesulfobacillus acetoxydans]CEJ07160.1 Trimethylamine methyltransferase MttB [Acididesulfobacillus acetoxydans]